MAKLPWKCWHEVVALRDDLKSGELPMHMFAADLYEVVIQGGKRPIYEDPEKFFALTFPTYNLRKLVKDVMLRVAGKNDKAVRQLELTYGGGKTHTLITLRHLVTKPDKLPKLPAVAEFREAIGQDPPEARVAALCFDKLDVEKGMEVLAPNGKSRLLKQPWSVLAWQLAGEAGLKLLHADGKAEERETAPAENLLTELLEMPTKEGLGVLILIDEVLMYAREKVASDPTWKDRIINFFQYLTQAATKVDRCCIVASLLASDPAKGDTFGRALQGDLYSIFQRQREEAVEPVAKEDVAEVLRRRFFTPESIKDRDAFRPHVQAALKGIGAIDDATSKQGAEAEERFLRSYPFHPDLTEVFYAKWTSLDQFQKARGVLRTFALALREAVKWDESPLVGPSVLLSAPGSGDLSEALRELVTVADSEEHEGKRQAWSGVLQGELGPARRIQNETTGLRFREIEQSVIATFLHSLPTGRTAHTRDLLVLVSSTRPDRIELEKGLLRWAQTSFWLDDQFSLSEESKLPAEWRLGNRPNLNQMHAVAASRFSEDVVRGRLVDEVSRVKALSAGASAAGVRVHTLPARPRDIEDDGAFHFAVLGPSCASDSGKPNAEARRLLDETTSTDKPRVNRNALLLLAPSNDGLELAMSRVRDALAWDAVEGELKDQKKDGSVDVARMQTLAMSIDKSRKRIPDAIRQAWSTVVTVSDKNEAQAFKINVTDDSHFSIIKNDPRSRVQESSITAEALLPGGPYDLWHSGETSRRVRDLSGAFAQLPHLPKMLKADAILDTLADGCEQGTFVLRLRRPDNSFRTWWRTRPDATALNDPAIELVLPEAAELADLSSHLLSYGVLPELWNREDITVDAVRSYFAGGKIVQVSRGGYSEPVTIPKVSNEAVDAAIASAVESGIIWLTNGPATLLGEPIPTGVLTPKAVLRQPPAGISAAEILSETLPDAWSKGVATALSISTALSQKFGTNLPWKSVRDVITAALNARFLQRDAASGEWPCEFASAGSVRVLVVSGKHTGEKPGESKVGDSTTNLLVAEAEVEPSVVQDLGDAIPKFLDIKTSSNVPIRFRLSVEVGDGLKPVTDDVRKRVNTLLGDLKKDWTLE